MENRHENKSTNFKENFKQNQSQQQTDGMIYKTRKILQIVPRKFDRKDVNFKKVNKSYKSKLKIKILLLFNN